MNKNFITSPKYQLLTILKYESVRVKLTNDLLLL